MSGQPLACTLRFLRDEDAEPIAEAFAAQGWHKPAEQYRRYCAEQQAGQRTVWVAWVQEHFVGYTTLCWESTYPPFRAAAIPEIVDLNVLKAWQRRGIATTLLDAAEALIAERSSVAGIGVGMTADYGAAQILYVRRGYIPDGRGLMASGRPLLYGAEFTVDDELVLYLTRSLGNLATEDGRLLQRAGR